MSRFNRLMDNRVSRTYLVGSILFVFIALFSVDQFARNVLTLGVNLTDSVPRGLYSSVSWRPTAREFRHGDYVTFCPPQNAYAQISNMPTNDRIHLLHPGICPMNAIPLIKTVAAIPGDLVYVEPGRNGWISINGIRRPASAQTAEDNLGQLREHLGRGFYVIPSSTFFAMGTNPRNDSWDSRYWGSVNMDSVISRDYPIVIERYK